MGEFDKSFSYIYFPIHTRLVLSIIVQFLMRFGIDLIYIFILRCLLCLQSKLGNFGLILSKIELNGQRVKVEHLCTRPYSRLCSPLDFKNSSTQLCPVNRRCVRWRISLHTCVLKLHAHLMYLHSHISTHGYFWIRAVIH